MSVVVTTYNILSSAFGNKKAYPKCTEKSLDASRRLVLLKKRLQEFIDGNHVICLQEVSRTWYAELFTFFTTRNYAFICSTYDNRRSDYMGSATAYPHQRYLLTDTKILCIGSTIQDVAKDEEGKHRLQSFTDGIPDNTIIYARSRPNTAIFLTLRTEDAAGKVHDFVVTNYHSPAAFWHDKVKPVITLHNVRYVIEAQRYAGDRSLICVGDFNNPPTSIGYKIITGGDGDIDASYPSDELWSFDDATPITWRNGIVPMREVNSDLEGVVTSQTIRTKLYPKESVEEVFAALWIDYIFYSEGISLKRANNIPSFGENSFGEPISLPTDEEPSDHLPVSASFKLL